MSQAGSRAGSFARLHVSVANGVDRAGGVCYIAGLPDADTRRDGDVFVAYG